MKAIIYKYVIAPKINVVQEIEIPYAAEFLKLHIQNDKIVLWFLIPELAEEEKKTSTEKRSIIAVWTGKDFEYYPTQDMYIDTVITSDGLVWHLFDITDRE